MTIHIEDVGDDTIWFVSTCTHVDEREDWDQGGVSRKTWIEEMLPCGLQIKVALDDHQPVGFVHLLPIEHSAFGLIGHDLLTIPCLALRSEYHGQGVGRMMMEAADAAARASDAQGLAVVGQEWDDDFWFMRADFFRHFGYEEAGRRGSQVILWKCFTDDVEAPRFFEPSWEYEPVPGKVAFDAFWNRQCLTTATEINNVREVCAEFGDRVLLREHDATDPAVRERHEIGRRLTVNGREIGWGYEAPRQGLRQAIQEALAGGDL
jgi:GNAT superfamily N-acetyltransferase